jgi:hypothetical protein
MNGMSVAITVMNCTFASGGGKANQSATAHYIVTTSSRRLAL